MFFKSCLPTVHANEDLRPNKQDRHIPRVSGDLTPFARDLNRKPQMEELISSALESLQCNNCFSDCTQITCQIFKE